MKCSALQAPCRSHAVGRLTVALVTLACSALAWSQSRPAPKPLSPTFAQHSGAPRTLPRPEPVQPRRSEPSPKRIEPAFKTAARKPPARVEPAFNQAARMRFTRETPRGVTSREVARTFNVASGRVAQQRAQARTSRQVELVLAKSRQYTAQGQRPIILGTAGMYRPVARRAGGQYFGSAYGDFAYAATRRGQLNPAVRERVWQRNKTYIERGLSNGTPILLAAPAGVAPRGGGYRRELGLLRDAVRSSNGRLRYVHAEVPAARGRTRKVIIGVESAARAPAAPTPRLKPKPR